MTVEEIEIVVTAKVEEALKEFEKMLPAIKKQMKQVQEAFSKIDTKEMQNKVQQATNYVKKRVQDLKQSSKNNEISIQVNNKDAQKQISQIQKQIDSLQEKINARQMKLNVINPQIDKIVEDTRKSVTPEGINPNDKAMDTTINNALGTNKDFTSLNSQAQKLYTEIEMYNTQLSEAKGKMSQLEQQTSQTATTQSKLGSFFSAFKSKIEQAKTAAGRIGTAFKNVGGDILKCINPMNLAKKASEKIFSGTKNIGSGIKNGIGTVLKYAGALFGITKVYQALRECASTWLSSQNAGAKQLSANIEYMKYAMGSALAPIIQFVTNLVYQLMKAIQSVAYALTGVNIFANASASAFKNAQKQAKNTSKQLSNVHSEINNVGDHNSNTSPNVGDMSKLNPTNSLLDAIKNGNWYEVGSIIGEKLNEAMNNIPWDKIQSTAKSIGTNIAQFLNGFIANTDWNQVGNTFAQGLNTIIYFGYSFVTTFNWKRFGKSIGNAINGFFNNIDWAVAAKTLSEGIKGLLSTISTTVETIDWQQLAKDLEEFVTNVDWSGIAQGIFRGIGAALGGLAQFLGTLISDAFTGIGEYFDEKIEECGGDVVAGIFKGIGDAIANIGQWIYDNIFQPFIDGFKSAFGIHSPSTVMAEQGNFIMQGLLNGITNLVDNVKQIWENMKNTAVQKFTDIKTSISNIWQQVTNKTSETWQNIKNKVKEGAQGAWNGITSIFGNIPNWFRDKFSQAWQAVKNVFSTGGRIFDGIKEGILSGLKSIVNAIIYGINKVIRIPFTGLNTVLRNIRNAEIMGLRPFSWIGTISVPQIPRLAKGGVLTEATTVLAGEYSGAKTNPEIVTPQNIMRDTFEDVLSNYSENNNDRPIYLTVNVGNQKLGQILLDNLRDKKRRTGKDIEALVGG
jgi:hypothetical protein